MPKKIPSLALALIIALGIFVTVTAAAAPAPAETAQTPGGDIDPKLAGSWGWFEGGGASGARYGYVYEFHRDGTFNLYKAVSLYMASSTGHTYKNAYEVFFKGKYTVSRSLNQIVFSDVVTANVTVGVNGDANGNWQSVGTRARAGKMQNQFPTDGYRSYILDPEEYKIIDEKTIGIGIDNRYGTDSHYRYDKDWAR